MVLRRLFLFAVFAVVAVCSPTLHAQQLLPAQGSDADELLPAPQLTPPLVPSPPSELDQPPHVPPTVAPLQSYQGVQEPTRLLRPMVIQRSDSHQKAIVYQKISRLPSYRVTYHDHHRLRRPCCPLTKMTIAIPDPLRPDCVAEICVTAPACVKGHPYVAQSPAFLGRGAVTLGWPNGHRVRVVFKKLAPHLIVHTYPA
jgi:hypothetical protein